MKIIESKKHFHSGAINYPFNDKNDAYEPNIDFFRYFLSIPEGSCECLGVSFWEFEFEKKIPFADPCDLVSQIISNTEIQSIIGYEAYPDINDKIDPEHIKVIKDPLSEFTRLIYKSEFYYSKPSELCKKVTSEFITDYFGKGITVLKGNFAWSQWFSNDGADYFYIIQKNTKIWLLNAYISD